jgi:hypothetical protein
VRLQIFKAALRFIASEIAHNYVMAQESSSCVPLDTERMCLVAPTLSATVEPSRELALLAVASGGWSLERQPVQTPRIQN